MSNTAAIVAKGDVIKWKNNTGSTVNVNGIVDVGGGLMGVLTSGRYKGDTTLADGYSGQAEVRGKVRVTKENGQVWYAGDELFWDSTNKKATRFGFGLYRFLGVAAEDQAETDAYGFVLINQGANYRGGFRYEYLEDFRGVWTPAATAAGGRGWQKTDTSSSGSPSVTTLTNEPGGVVKLLLDNTSEEQNLCLSHADILGFDIDHDLVFQARWKIGGANANAMWAIGMTGARNDAIDSIAQAAIFRQIAAALDLYIETDDGSENNDDKDTTHNLTADTYVHTAIDFRDTSDVKFYVNGARVCSDLTLDMSNYTGKLQPLMQLQKSDGTGVPYGIVDFIRITGKRAA